MATKKKSSRKVVRIVNGRILRISDNDESVPLKPDLSRYYFSNKKNIERFIEIKVQPRPEKYYEVDRNKLLLWFIGKYFK